MQRRLTGLAVGVAAALAIAGALAGPAALWLHYLCKPLATMLVFFSVLQVGSPSSEVYRRAILGGLTWSLAGDVALMLPADVLASGFLIGLGSFLVAHLFFLRAFLRDARLFGKRWVPLVLVVACALNLVILWPGLAPELRGPVIAYMLCLVAMSAQAVSRALALGTRASRLAGAGGLLFVLSDTLLAYDRFHAPLPAAPLLILASYYAALWLIASSVEAMPQACGADGACAR